MSPSFSRNNMTSSGRVAPVGHFGGAEVLSVRPGGAAPVVVISHGRHPGGAEIARCDAVPGAEILPGQPVHCPDGIYMQVLGEPHAIEVCVWHG